MISNAIPMSQMSNASLYVKKRDANVIFAKKWSIRDRYALAPKYYRREEEIIIYYLFLYFGRVGQFG